MYELLAFIAIVGFTVRAIVRTVMEADIRKMQLRQSMPMQAGQSAAPSSSEIEQLRAEIVRLRDTSTEHAMSLQHMVERIDRRVEWLEHKGAEANAPVNGTGKREIDIAPTPLGSTQTARLGE